MRVFGQHRRPLDGVLALMVAVILCAGGCVDTQESTRNGADPSQALQFANDERLDEHWRKHGLNPAEFNPVLTKDQYLKRAIALARSTGFGIETKVDKDGDALKYRAATNEFCVVASDKVIRTYFRPNSGRAYWDRQ